VFYREGGCGSCHSGPLYTDVVRGDHPRPFLHEPAEVGQDPVYANRSATGKYRTTPLRALWQHAPYFHDGSAPTLRAVVNHYDGHFRLNLTAVQKADLIEFLKSL
jgi:cytochrome c peroxidase